MSFLSDSELNSIGFKSVGDNVKLSRLASIYGASGISIGDDSRVDDFCVLSPGEGGIVLGRNVHLAVYCSLIGDALIMMDDFSGLSSRVSIYSSSDDYSGDSMTNPTVPSEFTNVKSDNVIIGKHVIIGAGSVVLPGSYLGEGTSYGALSLINGNYPSFAVYAGNPCRKIRDRGRVFLGMEIELNRGTT